MECVKVASSPAYIDTLKGWHLVTVDKLKEYKKNHIVDLLHCLCLYINLQYRNNPVPMVVEFCTKSKEYNLTCGNPGKDRCSQHCKFILLCC